MSSDIYARPDLAKKMRYTSKLQEDGAEWKEVAIYQSVDDIRHDPIDFQSQEGERQSEKHPPVQKGPYRGATLVLSVLCLLLLAGIIIVLITYHDNNSQLQDEVKQLNNKNQNLEANNSLLQDEVKSLNNKTKDLEANNSQLQRRYKTLSLNYSLLQYEVKNLRDTIEHEEMF